MWIEFILLSFFKKKIIYSILIALGLHCYHRLSHCVASHSGGFSYEAQALGMRAPVVAAHGLWNAGSLVVLSGLVALRPMESSQTRG